jgi:putative SOS response-associated peptidase YedK
MCNCFALEGTFYDLASHYQALPIGDLQFKGDIFPLRLAPALLENSKGQRALHAMQFGITSTRATSPSRAKSAHHNTPVEKPNSWPWQEALQQSRCVIPLAQFRLPSYWGDPEGTELAFQRADGQLLHAAGLYRLWPAPDGDPPRLTMCLLTQGASNFVIDHGYHRQPIFLAPQGIDAWIDPQPQSRDQALNRLRQAVATPELTYQSVGPLPASWKQHQNQMARKRGQQLQALEDCSFACGF